MTVPSIQWTMQKYSHSCNTVGPHHYRLKMQPPFTGVRKSAWVESVDLTWLVALQCQNDADSSSTAWLAAAFVRRVLLREGRDFFAGAETVGSSVLHVAAIAVTFRASVATDCMYSLSRSGIHRSMDRMSLAFSALSLLVCPLASSFGSAIVQFVEVLSADARVCFSALATDALVWVFNVTACSCQSLSKNDSL